MRAKGIRLEQLVLAIMLLAALCWNLANASEIKQLRVESGATGTRAELQLDRPGAYKVIELSNPERLVVDFPASRLGRPLGLNTATGAIRSVRTGQPEPGTVRVVWVTSTVLVAVVVVNCAPLVLLTWRAVHHSMLRVPAAGCCASVRATKPAESGAAVPDGMI